MNEIHEKLTTIKENKSKFKKVLKKSHFLSQKLIFHCLETIFLKQIYFFFTFVHMNVQNFWYILKSNFEIQILNSKLRFKIQVSHFYLKFEFAIQIIGLNSTK